MRRGLLLVVCAVLGGSAPVRAAEPGASPALVAQPSPALSAPPAAAQPGAAQPGSAPAVAAQPAPSNVVTTAEIPDRTGASDHPYRLGNVGRSVFFGIIAIAFLVVSAIAAAADPKKPRSRRPGA